MSKRKMYSDVELCETLDVLALEQADDERRLVWVKGRLVCLSEEVARFKAHGDQIERRARRLVARLAWLRSKIAAAGFDGAGKTGIL